MYNWLKDVISLYKDGLQYVAQIIEKAKMFFVEEVDYSEETMKILEENPNSKIVLEGIKRAIEESEQLTEEYVKDLLKKLQKQTNVKGKEFFMPIRVAITGEDHGPELVKIIPLVGKDKVINRLKRAINLIKEKSDEKKSIIT
jgi:nondiscriminating glutamyl-tRNA synthetase